MDAIALLRDVSDAYRALTTLAVEASVVTESGDENSNSRSEHRVRFLYAAPDRVRYKPLGDQGIAQVADGEFLHTAFGGRGFRGGIRYTKIPVRRNFRLPHLFRPDSPIAGGDEPYLFIGIDERVRAAEHRRDEDGCHVLAVTYEPSPHLTLVESPATLFWIDAKTRMVMRQYGELGYRFPASDDVNWTRHTISVRRMLIDDPLPADAFEFTPPSGAVVEETGGGCRVSVGGGSGFAERRPDGNRVEHRSSHEWEGDTLVERSTWRMRGMTLEFERRLTYSPDAAELRIQERVTGPKGDTETNLTLPVG
jgi:outer membrane lipoprotein-sorting protein